MISVSSDLRMLVLAVGFWVAFAWTEKLLNQVQPNPWDRTALLAGSFVSFIGAMLFSFLWCVVSTSLLVMPK